MKTKKSYCFLTLRVLLLLNISFLQTLLEVFLFLLLNELTLSHWLVSMTEDDFVFHLEIKIVAQPPVITKFFRIFLLKKKCLNVQLIKLNHKILS